MDLPRTTMMGDRSVEETHRQVASWHDSATYYKQRDFQRSDREEFLQCGELPFLRCALDLVVRNVGSTPTLVGSPISRLEEFFDASTAHEENLQVLFVRRIHARTR
jgi:hypothetical protein